MRKDVYLPAAILAALRPLQPGRTELGAAPLFRRGLSLGIRGACGQDPDRVADPSTLRRWFRSLDSSQPPFSSFLRTMVAISAWLDRTEILVHDSLPLRWHTIFPFLARFWPLRL